MKKNILAVIILAATLINLTLSAVMIFVFMPTVKQTNNLITKVAQIVDLELEDVTIREDSVEEEKYELTEEIPLNLSIGEDGKSHFAKLSCSVYLNKKAEDYSVIKGLMEQYEGKIREIINEEVSKLPYEEFFVTEKKIETKNVILERLQKEVFKSTCITSISFSDWVAQ